MCGRYYIEIDEEELRDIVIEVEKKTRESGEQLTLGGAMKTNGEIFPTDVVPVRTEDGGYAAMKWGFVGYNGKPVINARSETALEKPMFQNAMRERRCLIPAGGYYEWRKAGAKKVKYQFFIPGQRLHFAGCWRQEKGSQIYTFVILTRQAAGGAEAIHDRMPVIIPESRMDAWLREGPEAMKEAVTELSYKPAV